LGRIRVTNKDTFPGGMNPDPPAAPSCCDNRFVASAQDRSNAVGEFLKARRSQLTPAEVGLTETPQYRKVPGLRRSEVAQLAVISVEYYTRLEQGRVPPSAAVLPTLVKALRLDDDQQTYLYELAGKADTRPRRRRKQQVRPAMQRLLDQLSETPAFIFGRRMDILAWNAAASALYSDFDAMPARERNLVRMLFTNERVRAMHREWGHDARAIVAALRMEAAHSVDDPELFTLVGELSMRDPDFREWWAAHLVNSSRGGTKRYNHPVVGDLVLDCDVWSGDVDDGQNLVVLTAEPASPSHDALRILAAWRASTPEQPTPSAQPRNN